MVGSLRFSPLMDIRTKIMGELYLTERKMTKNNPFKTKWGQAADIKLFAFCPICQAMPGSDCRIVGGGVRVASHQDRQVVYQRMVAQYQKATVRAQVVAKMAPRVKSGSLSREGMVDLVGCVKCGADAGHNCTNPNGQKRKKVHVERMQAAQKVFNADRKGNNSCDVIDDEEPLSAQFRGIMQ